MRLLFISERYPPHITGGYEIACAATAEGLRRRGHEVRVQTSDYGITGSVPNEPGVDRVLHYKQKARSSWHLARWETADRQTLRNLLLSWKPDAVYAWSLMHLFPSLHRVLRDAGIPTLINIQDIWLPRHLEEAEHLRRLWYRPGPLPKRTARTVLRLAFRLRHPNWLEPVTAADLDHYHVVFCSRFRMEEHIARGLPSQSRRLIYNGIDPSDFPTAKARQPGEPLRVLFAGRLVHEKGVHTLVDAVVELSRRGNSDVTLTVAGPPSFPFDYADQLRESVESKGLTHQVRFLGMVPQNQLRKLYGQHHVLVFPSVGNEGMPMTILEAMASRLAVVGTTTGGSGELIRDGETGLAYPSGDANALADRLTMLAADSTLALKLAESGRRFVGEHFSLDAVLNQTELAFLEVLGRSRRIPDIKGVVPLSVLSSPSLRPP